MPESGQLDIYPPDMLRGTAIAKWAGLNQESICNCGHKFGIHVSYKARNSYNEQKSCQYCACTDFVLYSSVEEGVNDMASVNRTVEQNGFELAQKWAKIFVIKDNVDYQDKVALGMVFANQQGLNLENGASFVKGFVDGLTNSERVTRHLSLEDKVNMLLERELERKLDSPKSETNR